MKRAFSESAYMRYLDEINPRGITIETSDYEYFYKDAKTFRDEANTTFRTMYNDWLDMNEKDGKETGCYSEAYYKERRN